MSPADAAALLNGAVYSSNLPQTWADLGCGSGIFTHALATHLPPGSTLYALDKQKGFKPNAASEKVQLVFKQADFEKDTLHLPPLNGLLAANSLHYVADKARLLEKLTLLFRPGGRFIVVEYDTTAGNRWVPYPMGYLQAVRLFQQAGFSAEYLADRASVYGQGRIYAALFQKPA